MNHAKRTLQYLQWAIYSLSGLVCAFFLSWVILASVDFAYPVLHELLDITEHTERFGPQNRYRDDFELTNQAERERLFSEIVTAIHNDGKGLDSLVYHDANTGESIATLLHRAEIIHLTDVAILINVLYWVALIAAILWVTFVFLFAKQTFPIPTFKQQITATLILVTVCTILVLIIGPVKVFYAFHDWIFPANHQWFFYYQESLMTILMKAPYLFGYIAILLLALTLPLFTVAQLTAYKWVLGYNASQPAQAEPN